MNVGSTGITELHCIMDTYDLMGNSRTMDEVDRRLKENKYSLIRMSYTNIEYA